MIFLLCIQGELISIHKTVFRVYYNFRLFSGLIILIIGGFIGAFVSQSSAFQLVLAIGGAVLFSLFVVVDTQLLMNELSPEEYITATIQLYLDFINLFLYILRALQYSNQ